MRLNDTPILTGLALLLSLGCSPERAHPPPCTGISCYSTIPSTVDLSSGGSDGQGGAANVAGAGPTASISGQVVEVEDSTYAISTGALSTNRFVIQAPTADLSIFETTVGSSFTLDGVVRSRAAWLVAKPASSSDLMPGLVAFDSTTQSSVVVPLVRRSNLELVASLLTSMTTIDDKKAQVVLRFVNTSGKTVSGIRAAITGAAVVAYDYLGSYSIEATSTGTAGLAFLFNIPATDVPRGVTLALSGAVTAQYSFNVLAGAATVVQVLVQ